MDETERFLQKIENGEDTDNSDITLPSESVRIVTLPYRPTVTISTRACMICREATNGYICDKCLKAVLWAREQCQG